MLHKLDPVLQLAKLFPGNEIKCLNHHYRFKENEPTIKITNYITIEIGSPHTWTNSNKETGVSKARIYKNKTLDLL